LTNSDKLPILSVFFCGMLY